jgi:hypothetical protein
MSIWICSLAAAPQLVRQLRPSRVVSLLSPYDTFPTFEGFSSVSSPLPTGFGLPGATYIGEAVLGLPFMRGQSLAHEVLHNWWGNGVRPDWRSGNWSEGLTTLMADHALRAAQSPDAARQMRWSWLRDFAAVTPGSDAPLQAFTSRTHGAASAVGYGKSAMLFHMVRGEIGDTAFHEALRDLWRSHAGRSVAWKDLQAAFERRAGRSLAALFDPANQVVLRPHSALAAMGRYLDSTGKLPFPWMDGYTDMGKMVQLWDIALAEAVKAKGNVVQFWSGENEANAGFVANGATVGLCWDSTGFNLRNDGYGYAAPKEGAFAWHQGFVLMKNATNVEQAHELAKWTSTGQGAALWATAFSSNPVGKGAAEFMNPDVSKFYNSSFDDAKLAALWWWPEQSAEFIAKRGEYADKYKAS